MSLPTLTTDHPTSSYGMPVLLQDGIAFGPADTTPHGPAWAVVLAAARDAPPEYKALAKAFLRQVQIPVAQAGPPLGYPDPNSLRVALRRHNVPLSTIGRSLLANGADLLDYCRRRAPVPTP